MDQLTVNAATIVSVLMTTTTNAFPARGAVPPALSPPLLVSHLAQYTTLPSHKPIPFTQRGSLG